MPSLTEIRTIIATSKPTDWSLLEPGPTFLDRVIAHRGGDVIEVEEHRVRAVYRPDVLLGLAWGRRVYGSDDDDEVLTRYEWDFPDPGIWFEQVDVLWNGAIVDRCTLVVVDGGRGVLPEPSPMTAATDVDHHEVVAETATAHDVAVARLIGALDGRDFDDYFQRAEIVEIPDKP